MAYWFDSYIVGGNGMCIAFPSASPSPTPSFSAVAATTKPVLDPTSSAAPSDASAEECEPLKISIEYDDNPEDVSYTIRKLSTRTDYDTVLIYNAPEGETTHSNTVCLPEGSYEFIISDRSSDGICCDRGQGSYYVESNDKWIGKGGGFLSEEKWAFQIPNNFDKDTGTFDD